MHIQVMAHAGLRVGEAFGLQWQDFDAEARLLSVRRQWTHGAWSEPKTRAGRRKVPLGPELIAALKARKVALDGNVVRLPGATDTRLVFPRQYDPPIEYKNWPHRQFRPVRVAAGIGRGTPHWLRHTCGTTLRQARESGANLAALMGHTSAAFINDRNVHPWADAVASAGARVEELLSGATGSKKGSRQASPRIGERRKSLIGITTRP